MQWQNMVSSWVKRAAWDGGTLFVEFKEGAVCQYEGISLDLWLDFLIAPSKGQWVHANLITHAYTQVA